MKTSRIFVALVALTLPLALAGTAEAGRLACRGDFKKFCSTVKPGTGEAVECMKKHFDELSDGCKEFIKEAKAEKAAEAEKTETHAQQ
jgi:hypothetical protein